MDSKPQSVYAIAKLIAQARRLAADYRRTTGKSLGGVSGEIAEYDAARLLNLEICQDRSIGYDAIGKGAREGKRVQIKGRAIFDEKKRGQRIGQLKLEQQWDLVVLVLMDEDFEPCEIYEADRESIIEALNDSKESNRGKRGAMSVARFKVIGRLVWTQDEGEVEEIWDNKAGP